MIDESQENPKISIITVVFNGARTLEQTILSVVNQTYKNIEYIIIDGGSTDGTIDIIRKYEDRIAYWVSEPDEGIYDAMNKGIDVANGEYIYFLGAGDTLKTGVLEKIRGDLALNESRMVYGNVYLKHSKKIYDGYFSKYKITRRNICHQAIFYHKSIFEIEGHFDIRYKVLADWWLNLKCFSNDDIRKNHIDVIVAEYEEGGFSESVKDDTFYQDKEIYIKNNFGQFNFYRYILRKKIVEVLDCFRLKKILHKL